VNREGKKPSDRNDDCVKEIKEDTEENKRHPDGAGHKRSKKDLGPERGQKGRLPGIRRKEEGCSRNKLRSACRSHEMVSGGGKIKGRITQRGHKKLLGAIKEREKNLKSARERGDIRPKRKEQTRGKRPTRERGW